MPTIAKNTVPQTVITTFETSPATCTELIEALDAAYAEFISKQPGFIGAALHVNDAQTRVVNYSQWGHRKDYQAMLRSDEMRRRNREVNALCRSFEPVMVDVIDTFDV